MGRVLLGKYLLLPPSTGAALGALVPKRKIGAISAGAAADLITINMDLPTPVNKNNIFDQLLLYRNPEHVEEVFVAGKMVKAQGLLIGVDLQGIREETRQEAARLWKKIE